MKHLVALCFVLVLIVTGCMPAAYAASEQKTGAELLAEGLYREAVYAYRFSGTEEGLMKSYEIEKSIFWTDEALLFSGGYITKRPEIKWIGNEYMIALDAPDNTLYWFTAEENVSGGKPVLTTHNMATFNDYTRIYSAHSSAVMLEKGNGDITEHLYNDFIMVWREFDQGKAPWITLPNVNPENIVKCDGTNILTADGILHYYIGDEYRTMSGIVDFLATGDNAVLALQLDGTLALDYPAESAEWYEGRDYITLGPEDKRQFWVDTFMSDNWKNLIDIRCSDGVYIGIKKDGSVVATYSLSNQLYITEEIPEMKGIYDIKPYVRSLIMGENDWKFIGLREDGTLVSNISNFPLVENVLSYTTYFEAARSAEMPKKDGCGGLSVFCIMKDGSFMRFGVSDEDVDPKVRKLLPPIISDEAVEAINNFFPSLTR